MTSLIAGLALGVAAGTLRFFAKAEKQHKKELYNLQLQIKTFDDRVDRLAGDWLSLKEEVIDIVQKMQLTYDNKIKEALKVLEEIQEKTIKEADEYLRARSYESQRESFIDEVVDRINRKQLNVSTRN